MANETIVALPENVLEESSLRRVLSVIISNLDSAIGNRDVPGSLYNEQKNLESRIATLESADKDLVDEETESISTEISSLKVTFNGRVDNGSLTIVKSVGIVTGIRTAVGVYEIYTASESTLANSYFTSNLEISVTHLASNSVEIKTYRNGALFDPTLPVTVSATYVS